MTRILTFLASFALAASSALAQEAPEDSNTGIVGPLPPTGVNCYKLQDQPNRCVIATKPSTINYQTPTFNVIDLNGAWQDGSGKRPYIYVYGDSNAGAGHSIAFDLSLLNRPDGFGYISDATTLIAVFPDDRDYTGTIEANGKQIRWSNNTVWTKL